MHNFLVGLGDVGNDTLQSEVQREWTRQGKCVSLLSQNAEARVCAIAERYRMLRDEGIFVSCILFPSGDSGERMGAYAERLFALVERDPTRRPSIVVNRDKTTTSLTQQMRWATQQAENRSHDPRLEFFATDWQSMWIGIVNWWTVRIPRWQVHTV